METGGISVDGDSSRKPQRVEFDDGFPDRDGTGTNDDGVSRT